ncbi:undecaprenyl-phosphate glucose phosphotransferase [Bradyrhizobium sp. AS23.2]|uniref:undecaprenyl-phosphate glucose phosphotransferase n=1 Tax=Bradyrhizobium sp. AS23.2 TaxID=1680155 RepID=UPI00094024A0|nr:undecaprenyl-phosphate glucose phosphotransferase [Bradyrhizobium sp. AS23.2]
MLAFNEVGSLSEYLGEGGDAGLFFVLLMNSLGLYRASILLSRGQLRAVAGGWLMAMAALVGFLFLLKSTAYYSRGGLITFALLGVAFLLGWRVILAAQLRNALAEGQVNGRRVILIGDEAELARHSPRDLLMNYGAHDIGRFPLSRCDPGGAELFSRDSEIITNAIRAARTHEAEKVLIAISWNDEQRRKLICERLRILPVPIFLLPDRSSETLLTQPLMNMGRSAVIQLQRAALSRVELFVKRGFDLILATLGGILALPLLLIVAILIKLESAGPLIFKQRRRGFNGREFTIYKLRTMTVLEDGPNIRQAERNDVRITRVGSVLRRTSIDEVPQLLNVLLGDMSLVGPRPHAVAHDDQYSACIGDYAFRNHVKPGLTGWAQVNGLRGETAQIELMKRRVDYDVWYINNWSLWLDILIVARTFFTAVWAKNAY